MKIRQITTLREFDALAPVWREVTQESGQTSPFLSHDWFACCWRTAGPDRRRELWLLEDSAGPVALVPLVRARTKIHGIPVRTVQLLDSPDTPFVDIPVARALDDAVVTILDALHARQDWDLFALRKLPADAATLKAFAAELPDRYAFHEAGRLPSPYVTVSGGWEEFFRGKTQRFRKTCRNMENRIQREGAITVEEHRAVDPDGPIFAELMDVSYASWKGPRGLGLATMQGVPRFFRELTQRASENGWLHLWILRMGGRAVATEYQITDRGVVHALRADFDAAASATSPGSYLNLEIIRSLFGRPEVHLYDMGPGENEYKLRWASGNHETIGLDVYAPTIAGRLVHALQTKIVPRLKRWLSEDPECT